MVRKLFSREARDWEVILGGRLSVCATAFCEGTWEG